MLEDTNAECRPRSCAAPCCPVSRTWCTVTRHFSKENWDNFTKQAKKKQRFTHICWGTRISKLCPFNLLPLCISQAACKCRKKAYNFFLNYKWMHLPPPVCMTMNIKTHSFCRAESYHALYKEQFQEDKKPEFTGQLESYRGLLIYVPPIGMIKDKAFHHNNIWLPDY